jgi:hypothetical protein
MAKVALLWHAEKSEEWENNLVYCSGILITWEMQCKWKDNTKDDIKEIEYEEVDWIHLPACFKDGNKLQGSEFNFIHSGPSH